MARKHAQNQKSSRSRPPAFNHKDSSIKRWNTASDIPLDEEDQFHVSRDKILLEGEDLRSDDEGDEDEVFALKGMDDTSEEEDEERDEDESENEPKKLSLSPKNKSQARKAKAPSSDEGSESESEEEGWGRSKAAYYSSNAGQIDSEDEEANEMEEQEAIRLQAKTRDTMVDSDFGLDDPIQSLVEAESEFMEEPATASIAPLPQDKQSLLRHLARTNPEALALARDWEDTARTLVKSQEKISRIERENPNGLALGMMHLYNEALMMYAATLAFYLHLRSSEKYASRPELLQTHPIMSRLLTLKQSVSTLEDLDFGLSDHEDDGDEDSDDDESESGLDGANPEILRRMSRMDAEELEGLLAELRELTAEDHGTAEKPKKESKKPSKVEAQIQEPPKKKRKTNSEPKTSVPVFDLEEPTFPTKPRASSRLSTDADTDAYGENISLQAADAADKAARKKSLRFHTAKIESASARRERARTNTGGDDDIPWKERKRDRELKNKKELEKTRGMGGDDLDDEEPEPREMVGKKRMRDEDRGGEDEEIDETLDGYYDLVKRKSKEKKEKKKAEYEATQAATREGLAVDDTTDGPRSLTRAILKNKGLTPRRSKSVRNPRVKKRQRYEQAKKKVSSQKAVYKGGVGATGHYEGEKSGISKVIKGTRLS